MKIAVNTRLLLKNKLEGIGWFMYETLKRITFNHPEHEFVFFFDRPPDPAFVFSENVKAIRLFPQARHPILFHWYFDLSIARALKREKAGLFLSPDGFLSLRTLVPQLPVIHDLNFEHHPETLPPHITRYYRKNFPRFAKMATRIATVSEYSKSDITKTYGIDPLKIDVVYNGVNNNFKVLGTGEVETERKKTARGKPYFVFVGSLHPRKNILRLLKAWELFRERTGMDVPMVIVGEAMWSNSDVKKQLSVMKYRNDVIFTGRLKQEALARVVGAAMAMTFVPLFEGFGIPALEAMKSGVPLIASNRTSLPEVAGEAAALVDPENIEEIAGAMRSVAMIEEVRKKMIERGLQQAARFTWDRSAKRLWASVEKTLEDVKGL